MKRLVFIVLLLLSVKFALAQYDPLYWEIKPKNSTKTSYLLGVPYVLCANQLVFGDAEKQMMLEAEQIFFQSDISSPEFMTSILAYKNQHKGFELKKIYSPEEYLFLASFCKDSLGVDINNIQDNYQLFSLIISKSVGCDPQSAETPLIRYAIENNKKIIELESPTAIFEQLDKISSKDRAACFLNFVKSYNTANTGFRKVKNIYASPSEIDFKYVKGIATYFSKAHYKYLVEDRAKNWTSKMQMALKDKASFVVVPMYLLPGKKGILKQLEERGFEIKAVNPNLRENIFVQNE
ncbi:TraB/GumN family protein [Solitalea sp. MAHUQ-68]|uniref:TraB/GumN family protein n=1 Tax=Solitalea agri TaxID=2953739 RepID=A0A9X2F948_9SPHI|nr:TraB/GumN family protein [Solitalea agri]MCO4294616.1 TraB/GumN family protein [Solitalea agri]